MKLVLAQFESNLTNHSAHSYYYLVVVVLVHERLEEVGDELFLDLANLDHLENFENGLDCLYPHVRLFVIEKFINLRQVDFFKSLGPYKFLVVSLQVFFHKDGSFSPDLIVGVLAHG